MDRFEEFVYEGSFMNKPLRMRRATLTDYDDVMQIDEDIYGGADYLPSTYHEMVDEPTAHCFIAELDGKVIGFVCAFVDGLTNTMTTTTAGRIATQYRHRGLYVELKKFVALEMKKIYPHLLVDWSFSARTERVLEIYELAKGRLIDPKDSICAVMLPEDIRTVTDIKDTSVNVYRPSPSQLTDLLRSTNVLRYLYPKGVFVRPNGFRPFPATEHLTRQIIGKEVEAIISGTLESDDLALSMFSIYSCQVGMRLAICYDGTPDASVVMAHFLMTVKMMSKQCMTIAEEHQNKDQTKPKDKPKLNISLLFPSAVDKNPICEFIKQTFHCNYSYDAFGVFEKPYI